MARRYELRQRARRQEATRQRIVEATVAMHEELGLLRTTITDIAERAGVERATVYRHFPDEHSLFAACTGHYFAQHPLPAPDPWRATADPAQRLGGALTEIYAYHRSTERMISRTSPDIPDSPAMQEVASPIMAYWERVRDVLAEGWGTSEEQRGLVAAAVGHAIAFFTWQSLVREQHLDDAQAVEMMVTMVRCLACEGSPATSSAAP